MGKISIAIIQKPPAVLDLQESIRRAVLGMEEAVSHGAELVVFPETWLTCYPAWVFGMAGWRDGAARHWYRRLLEESPVLDASGGLDDELAPIRKSARELEVTVILGLNERPANAGGSLFNSIVTIGRNGRTLNLHRKISPTHTERIVWAQGDGAGLKVVDSPSARVGSLVCWEHFNPLARQALHAQNEELHVALWPDMTASHEIATRFYALEGRCFVISAAQIVSSEDIPPDLLQAYRVGVGAEAPEQGWLFNGGSCVASPDGSWVIPPVFDESRIISTTLNLEQRYEEVLDLDVAGHYARPDIFRLSVDDSRRSGGGVEWAAPRAGVVESESGSPICDRAGMRGRK